MGTQLDFRKRSFSDRSPYEIVTDTLHPDFILCALLRLSKHLVCNLIVRRILFFCNTLSHIYVSRWMFFRIFINTLFAFCKQHSMLSASAIKHAAASKYVRSMAPGWRDHIKQNYVNWINVLSDRILKYRNIESYFLKIIFWSSLKYSNSK